MKLSRGDWVEVRSKEEILATLDKQGQLDGLPFMPQMFRYCGKRFQVFKRAHKTCDTVTQSGGRCLRDTVHLELRCDGKTYGGCQAACLLFWKDAWLKRINQSNGSSPNEGDPTTIGQTARSPGCTEEDVLAATVKHQSDGPVYACQATQLLQATTALKWYDVRQYVEDYFSGNISLLRLLRGLLYASYFNLSQLGIGIGPPMRWFYDLIQKTWGGLPYPRRQGKIPAGKPTPGGKLDLQPGELVRVKSYKEILATLDTNNKNRGLYFDAEAVPYCGRTFRVASRVGKIVDEKTGRLIKFKNESIILEGVYCQARYSDCRMFCPRSICSYWREIWLERVSPQQPVALTDPSENQTKQGLEAP